MGNLSTPMHRHTEGGVSIHEHFFLYARSTELNCSTLGDCKLKFFDTSQLERENPAGSCRDLGEEGRDEFFLSLSSHMGVVCCLI